MFAKIGPRTKRNSRLPSAVSSRIVVPVMSEGIRSGRELDALERDVENLRDRADHERLGQAGHADQQAVPAGEDRGEDLLDDLALPDDDAAELVEHGDAVGGELVQVFGEAVGADTGGPRARVCGWVAAAHFTEMPAQVLRPGKRDGNRTRRNGKSARPVKSKTTRNTKESRTYYQRGQRLCPRFTLFPIATAGRSS